jgi:CheY-like chemotaxis protein
MTSILVIEDDIIIRTGIQRILTKEGYTAILTNNGAEGLLLAKEHSPGMIICDIAMPEMDGFQVLAAIRAMPQFAKTPFLFLSAKITTDDVKRGIDAGATAYLKKPMWPDDIITAVQKYV